MAANYFLKHITKLHRRPSIECYKECSIFRKAKGAREARKETELGYGQWSKEIRTILNSQILSNPVPVYPGFAMKNSLNPILYQATQLIEQV